MATDGKAKALITKVSFSKKNIHLGQRTTVITMV